MKIHIYYNSKIGAWGGGNQFLKALKHTYIQKGVYAETSKNADAIIFNGYQELLPLCISWVRGCRVRRVYRLGPVMSLHRSGLKWKIVDWMMVRAANFFADIVIFQSQWSYDQACLRGFKKSKTYSIVHNAVDSTLFYPKNAMGDISKKTRLVYTSWSSNPNKGFAHLQFLDTHLDFGKYEITCVGNIPSTFTNIRTIKPLPSDLLAQELRAHHIFISPTKDDACSNAILEGLACGLPVVALRSGANAELIADAGVLFDTDDEFLAGIDLVANHRAQYQSCIQVGTIEIAADKYIAAIYGSITNI